MHEGQTSHADNGWERSATAWIRLMEAGDTNRTLLLDDVMLGLCGEVSGKDVLDVGCGEGRFARMLAQRGARVCGIDPTASLIADAKRKDPAGNYLEAFAENLPIADASMDLVVSYVALVDIAGYREAIMEMARVLRPGGRCVVANLNGFNTASTHFWARDEDGNKLHWTMDNYMTERPVRSEWAGLSIVNWHRPASAYMKAFLDAGLILKQFDEPLPSTQAMQRHEGMRSLRRMPHFCTMTWARAGT